MGDEGRSGRGLIGRHLLTAAALLLLVAALLPHSATARGEGGYQATVARTRYGVAHVTAGDWGSLGYGYGYALADDNLCVLAEAIVTFRGERSRYFGAQGTLTGESTLGNPTNLDADFFFRDVLSDAQIARFRAAQPPDLDRLVTGFAAGFSRYAREVRAGARPGRHQACRNADWLGDISAPDVYRRLEALALAAGSVPFVKAIAEATPPVGPHGARQDHVPRSWACRWC
jgi:acyl-homoserine-lactone acylase